MEIIVTIVIIIVLLISLIVWLHYRLTYWSRQGITNAISSIYSRLTKPIHFADKETYSKHGRIVGVYDGLRPCLMIGEPELIKKVLVTEFDNFQNHRIFYQENQIAGRSLLSLENDQWKRIRKIMTPLFSSSNLKKMKPLIEECSQLLVDNLGKRIEFDQIVEMKQLFGAFSLDVLASTVFGIRNLDSINSQTNEIVLIVAAFLGDHLSIRSLILLWFPYLIKLFNFYVFNYRILIYLNSLVQKILNRTRLIKARTRSPSTDHQQQQQSTAIKDFLTLLDEANIQLTDKELDNQTRERVIIDNGILFIIAGYDTTSTSLSSIIYCLSLFPDYQQLIVDEIESLRRQLNRCELTLEETNSLSYLNGCILEALRCFPPVPRIERRVNRNCTLGTIKLIKDSLVIIPCYAINRDANFYPNPSIYDPSRFINEGTNQQSNLIVDNNLFLPFAAGPRNCIGMRFALMEIKICLINVLTRYRFSVTLDTKVPLDYFIGMPVSAPKEVKVMVTPRK